MPISTIVMLSYLRPIHESTVVNKTRGSLESLESLFPNSSHALNYLPFRRDPTAFSACVSNEKSPGTATPKRNLIFVLPPL